MGFVGNYALGGLSPQIYDMPVILKNEQGVETLLVVVNYKGNISAIC
jgi:hypothetical protein